DQGHGICKSTVNGVSCVRKSCLIVDDAAKAYERALALDAEPFTQPVEDGELELPAIRGVGGGIIYLIDDKSALGRFSEIDFQTVTDDS
ncbi:hypothetical protein ACC697_38550, partial [Rhizobium ruizarguesonis]